MYSNVMLEMLVHKIPLSALCDHLCVSEYDVIRKLKNEIPITFGEAVTIKAIIGSDLPLEELFEVVE